MIIVTLMYYWNDVLNVPDADPNKAVRTFLTMYEIVTMEECAVWANLFMLARGRTAQNSQMMDYCILDLINMKFKTQLMMEVEKFMVWLCVLSPYHTQNAAIN
jgi:hypothetical protein